MYTTHACTHAQTDTHTCTHACVHTHTHAHTYTPWLFRDGREAAVPSAEQLVASSGAEYFKIQSLHSTAT